MCYLPKRNKMLVAVNRFLPSSQPTNLRTRAAKKAAKRKGVTNPLSSLLTNSRRMTNRLQTRQTRAKTSKTKISRTSNNKINRISNNKTIKPLRISNNQRINSSQTSRINKTKNRTRLIKLVKTSNRMTRRCLRTTQE